MQLAGFDLLRYQQNTNKHKPEHTHKHKTANYYHH